MDPRASSTKFFIFNRTNIVFSFLHFYLWKIFLHFSQDSFVLIKYKGEILEFVENNLKYYYYRFEFISSSSSEILQAMFLGDLIGFS